MAGEGADRWVEASSRLSSSRHSLGSSLAPSRQVPQLAFFVLGTLLRLLSVYAFFRCLSGRNENASVSITVFTFLCLMVSGGLLMIFHRPWLGRSLSSSQVYLTVLNGAVLALALVLWGKSLGTSGPVRRNIFFVMSSKKKFEFERIVLAEYTGAALGAASTLALGKRSHKWKKGGGLAIMLTAYYILFKGWTIASLSPFSAGSGGSREELERMGLGSISMSIAAGILLALRRVVARRVSMQSTTKKRLHALTVAAAACFLFPFAVYQLAFREPSSPSGEDTHGSLTWAFLSTVLFGMVAGFYVDSYAEDRLHIHATSSEHLLVTSVLLIFLELAHHMDFSLIGFLICSSLLGLGIYEAASIERLAPSELITTNPPSMKF